MKKILLILTMLLLFSGMASAILKMSSDLTYLTGGAANFSNLSAGSGYLQDRGSCANRPLVSTMNRTLSVPSTYPTIQAAVCEVPFILRHRYIISVNPATYTGNENVSISNVYATKNYDKNGGNLIFAGGSAGNYVKINSFMASGMTGQANPFIQYYNATGWSPDYGGVTGGCQWCFFGVQEFEMNDIVASSTWNNENETHAILAYGGSRGKVGTVRIENSSWFGISMKQGSDVWVRDGGIAGTTKGPCYGISIGSLYIHDETSGASVLKCNKGVTGVSYSADQGILYWSDNDRGYNQSAFGIDRLPDLDELTIGSGATEYRASAYRGFRYFFDVNNNMVLERKTGSTSVVNVSIWNLTSGTLHTFGNVSLNGEHETMGSLGGENYIQPLSNEFFCRATGSCFEPFEGTAFASGTLSSMTGTANHPGIQTILSSTTASSGYALTLQTSGLLLSGGERFTVILAPITAYNGSGVTAIWNMTAIRTGFIDAASASDSADGVYFNITQLLNNTFNVTGVWRSNSAYLNATTSYMLMNNTFYKFVVTMENSTRANFSIYNETESLKWSQSLNAAPFATGRETGAGISAFIPGGTAAYTLVGVDFMKFEINRKLIR